MLLQDYIAMYRYIVTPLIHTKYNIKFDGSFNKCMEEQKLVCRINMYHRVSIILVVLGFQPNVYSQ